MSDTKEVKTSSYYALPEETLREVVQHLNNSLNDNPTVQLINKVNQALLVVDSSNKAAEMAVPQEAPTETVPAN